ncbi:PEP-CTERM sorting domain-containing protein [Leptothoe sp. PORK10 BA2]|uniref:PEP-CTERM sorting domain-containing protein n=1 Tax=Leptothoe sp. PORK10 BA2 TaxID=3110254 RepID=UPI002B20290D|nr:PEP-CTERM sorting domain-containing protein [Leptothoe sp. PORK10 BA2]MEA5462868.1 PEP-CTERM sorting domain-containing protein [Leptothoe sp. PORK10 BA2]
MKVLAKRVMLGAIASASLLTVGAVEANAADIKATVTADNFYGLFYGNEDGSNLNFVGRNETGDGGSSGGYNWSKAESWDFEVNNDDYLYLVAWDDGRVAESWIGEFEIAGKTLLSGADDWEYIVGDDNPYLTDKSTNLLPGSDELTSLIDGAEWQDTVSIGKNGINPWKTIDGVDQESDWLKTASHTEGKYTIFRTGTTVGDLADLPDEDTADVPEPASMLGLLAVGAMVTTMKRKFKA